MSLSITNVTPVNGALPALLYDANGNPLVLANKAVAAADQAGLPTIMLNDGIGRLARGDVTGGTGIARFMTMFLDMVDGAAVNTQLWTQSLTTMTVTQATRLVTMNAGNSIAASVHAIHTSLRQFIKPLGAILRFSSRMRFDWQATNGVLECGFGNPATTTAAIPTGAFVRVSAGTVKVGISYASSEIMSADLAVVGSGAGQLTPSSYYSVDVFVKDDSARFVIQRSDDTLDGLAEAPVVDYTLRFPVAAIAEWSAISSPAFFRVYNTAGGTATASHIYYSGVSVTLLDVDTCKPWAEQLAASGRGLLLNPASGVQLANYANTAAPASATLSNTAAGYTTLGGQFQWAAVAGAETDFALFAFTVPTGRTLHVKRLRIELWNTVVAVATTAFLLQWGVGRAAAVTLAANSFRQVIGAQYLPVGAAVGQTAAPTDFTWESAFVVESGQIFHIIVKIPIGTATATEILRGVAVVDGYLE